jgi:signal transduction histidine kinase
MARWLSRKLTSPVADLTAFVREIAETDRLDKRVGVTSNDELGVLAQSFNSMANSLQQAASERERFVGELETLNRTLEAKVAERTRALETINADLSKAFGDLKSAQAQLVQSEKMASLGQLVAGIAHEINNPIAFLYANFPHLEEYAETLLSLVADLRALTASLPQAERAEELVRQADLEFLAEDMLKVIRSGKGGAARIKEIVRSLRSFSRLDEAEFKPALLEDGLDDTLAILHHHMKGRIELKRDYALRRPVPCFPGQINQVFMNILYNAIQAIEGPGTIEVSTGRDGDWAVVTISDSGAGIPPDVMAKIFDPFFTTKKVGEGTGLGLSISYGIIETHGGRIDVASRPGEGTRFQIRLPLPSNPPTETRDAP